MILLFRTKVQKVQEVLCSGFLDVLRLSSLRSRYYSVYEKVSLKNNVSKLYTIVEVHFEVFAVMLVIVFLAQADGHSSSNTAYNSAVVNNIRLCWCIRSDQHHSGSLASRTGRNSEFQVWWLHAVLLCLECKPCNWH